ncbi:hypothetical protein LCGC14_1301720 [marine sediment metagenome]|uniref:Uncharacterized protein n=1 Tax=marine sediment metagenome TaxID=412755 RepID=A0A0F9KPR3_9ZZZZ
MDLTKKQEEDIDKLVDEGIIQDKEQFIREAVSKHLNKSEIKKELKKINGDKPKESERDIVRRIGREFSDKLEDIKKKITKLRKVKRRISNGDITNMIIKHESWPEVEEDLINHEYDKK